MRRLLTSLLGLLAAAPALGRTPPELPVPMAETIVDPEAWLARRMEEDAALGVWPQAMPRIHRNVEGKASTAILFIHGWGATRAEGEYVVDRIADEWNANVFYMRLPGHGIDAAAQRKAEPAQYTRAVAEALAVTEGLGDQVVVMGTSTGGLLATWAAGNYPDRVHALVLLSPLYEYSAGWIGPVLNNRAATGLVRLALGKERYAGWEGVEDRRDLPGYDDHWLITQESMAMVQLDQLRRGVMADRSLPERVSQPVLLLHFYKDDDHKDTVVSTEALLAMYDRFRAGSPHPQSRRVPIADGNHVLTSQYVRVDHEAVLAAMRAYFTDVFGPPAP
jgi:pimeloyl-ACP methyl ester carboxylesterase